MALGPWGFAPPRGLALAWAYSAPPLRLKRNGWWGNAACGLCYEGLAWVTGAAVMAGGAMPEPALAAAGRAVQRRRARHHDAQRLQVDRGRPPHGHRLAAGAAGSARAAMVACWTMAVPQAVVVVLLLDWGRPAMPLAWRAAGRRWMMRAFVADPRERRSGTAAGCHAVRARHAGQRLRAARRGGAAMSMSAAFLLLVGIFRLGLVQAALGAVVVLTTSTLNRVMVVELALPALLPGALVALHYAGADAAAAHGLWLGRGRRRTPWIVGGMAVLALGGGWLAARHGLDGSNAHGGLALAVLAFAPGRPGRQRQRHLAAGAAGQARGRNSAAPAPPPWCG
jgi:hypothetical protein